MYSNVERRQSPGVAAAPGIGFDPSATMVVGLRIVVLLRALAGPSSLR